MVDLAVEPDEDDVVLGGVSVVDLVGEVDGRELDDGLDPLDAERAPLDAGRAPTDLDGVPRSILLHPTKASEATVAAVGRFAGERYLQPAKARAPMLDRLPSTYTA